MRSSSFALLLAFGLVFSSPTSARAQEDTETQAVAFHQQGLELYEAGDYAGAVEQFLHAQELVPAPSNVFNLSRCYEQLGDVPRAMELLEQYVADPSLEPERRARGQQELARLMRAGGEVEVTTEPPGAQLLVDGRPQDPAVLSPATLHLAPGDHLIEAQLEGHEPVRQEVTITPAGRTRLALDLGAGTAVEQPGDERRVTWTALGQIALGASLALMDEGLNHSFAAGFDVGAGLNLGRHRHAPRGVEKSGASGSRPCWGCTTNQ